MVTGRFKAQKIIISLMVMACYLVGCAATDIPNLGQKGFKPQDDEIRFKKRADEFTELLDNSGYIYRDDEFEKYLNAIADQFLTKEMKSEGLKITVKMIKDPTLNAFALPNGRIYIHTGIIATTENEAQLASLLAHEMMHVINRHALKQMRSLINKTALYSVIQTPAAIAGGGMVSLIAELSIISSIRGYSQHHEREADIEGFKMLIQNGYDVKEAPKLFEHLKEFIESEDIKQPFFFSTHPSVVERIENFKRLIKEQDQTTFGKKGNDKLGYFAKIEDIYLKNIDYCLSKGVFKTAESYIDRLISYKPDQAIGYFYKGELYRQRQDPPKGKKKREKEKDYKQALVFYDKAIGLDVSLAAAYQGKGRILQKLNQNEQSKEMFIKYLELKPDAEDKGYILDYIQNN